MENIGEITEQKQNYTMRFKYVNQNLIRFLRKTECNYFGDFGNKLEEINTKNPREFWDKIKFHGFQKRFYLTRYYWMMVH